MKWFAKIVAIYLLALVGIPCSDTDNRCPQANSQQEAPHDHAHDNEDYCSPFCHCACCGATITIHVFQGEKLTHPSPGIAPRQAIAPRKPFFISSYSGEIWQPPQLLS